MSHTGGRTRGGGGVKIPVLILRSYCELFFFFFLTSLEARKLNYLRDLLFENIPSYLWIFDKAIDLASSFPPCNIRAT